MSTYKQRSAERQRRINKAVDALSDAINEMTVKYEMIEKAFLGVHPYLLNQIGLGLLKAVSFRSRITDGRICGILKTAAKEAWA